MATVDEVAATIPPLRPAAATSAPRASGEVGVWSPARRGLTVGMVLTVTLVAFEALAVSTIMPVVARQLGDVALYGWAFSAFFLGTLVGIVVAGQQIDRGGLVRPFAIGLVLFGVGLTIGGLAPSMPVLIGARLIQGLGGGAIPTVTYVAIGRVYPDAARPRMFAILSTAWVVPALAGPAAAAFIAQFFDWRLVFFSLLPFLVVAAVLTVPALRRVGLPPADRDAPSAQGRLVPAVVTAVAAGVLLAGLTSVTWWGLLIAVVAAGRRAHRGRAARAAGHAARTARPARHDRPARHHDLRLLRRRGLPAPGHRPDPRPVAAGRRPRPDHGHDHLDDRLVDPVAPRPPVGRAGAHGPRPRLRGAGDRRSRRRSCSTPRPSGSPSWAGRSPAWAWASATRS